MRGGGGAVGRDGGVGVGGGAVVVGSDSGGVGGGEGDGDGGGGDDGGGVGGGSCGGELRFMGGIIGRSPRKGRSPENRQNEDARNTLPLCPLHDRQNPHGRARRKHDRHVGRLLSQPGFQLRAVLEIGQHRLPQNLRNKKTEYECNTYNHFYH